MAGNEIVRHEIIKISFKINVSVFSVMNQQMNMLKDSAAALGKSDPFAKWKAVDLKNPAMDMQKDIESFNAKMSLAKQKIDSFKNSVKSIAAAPLQTLDRQILAVQMSTGKAIAQFKSLAHMKFDNAKTSLTDVKNVLTEGEPGVKGFTNGFKNIGKIGFEKTSGGIKNIINSIKDGSSFAGFSKVLGKIPEAFEGIKTKVRNVVTSISNSFKDAAKKIGDVVKKGILRNDQMMKVTMDFKPILGGNEQAARDLAGKLQKMADSTIFEMSDMTGSAHTLLKFGVTADEVIPTLQMIGDISRGDSYKFSELTTAFAQVKKEGTLTEDSLSRMKMAGFDPLEQMSKTTGQSLSQLEIQMDKGGISAEMMMSAFADATKEGGLYYKALEEKSKTYSGQMDIMKSKSATLLGAMTGGIQETLVDGILPKINGLIDSLSQAFETGGFSSVFKRMEAVELAVQGVIEKIQSIANNSTVMESFREIFGSIHSIVGNLAIILGDVVTQVMDLGTLETGLSVMQGVFDGINTAVQFCKDHLNGLIEIVGSIIKAFVIFQAVIKAAQLAMAIYNGVVAISTTISNIAKASQLGFNAVLAACPITWIVMAIIALIAIIILLVRNWDKVKAAAMNCWDSVKAIWGKAADWIKITVVEPIMKFFGGLCSGIADAFQKALGWIKDNWKNIIVLILNPFAGIFALLYKNCEGFRNFVDNILSTVKQFFVNLVSVAVGVFGYVWSFLQLVWGSVASWVYGNVIQPIILFFGNLWLSITSGLQNIWNTLCTVWGQITGWISVNIVAPVMKIFAGLWNNLTTSVLSVKSDITGAFQQAWNTVTGLWQGLTNFFSNLWNSIEDIVEDLGNLGKTQVPGAQGYSKATNRDKAKYAWGGLVTTRHIGTVAESGAEMIIPLSSDKRKRAIDLWTQTGSALGVKPAATPAAAAAPEINRPVLSGYTPENSSVKASQIYVTEQNSYAPQFNLSISGTNDDRAMARKVKQWVAEAMDETFISLQNKNKRLREV